MKKTFITNTTSTKMRKIQKGQFEHEHLSVFDFFEHWIKEQYGSESLVFHKDGSRFSATRTVPFVTYESRDETYQKDPGVIRLPSFLKHILGIFQKNNSELVNISNILAAHFPADVTLERFLYTHPETLYALSGYTEKRHGILKNLFMNSKFNVKDYPVFQTN